VELLDSELEVLVAEGLEDDPVADALLDDFVEDLWLDVDDEECPLFPEDFESLVEGC